MGTLLVLTPLSGSGAFQLTPYAARGLTQTYAPLKSAGGAGNTWVRRDVNGVLRELVDTRFRKYKSTISCHDGETPCLDDAWIGVTVEVHCAFELNYVTGMMPARPEVSGSARTQGAFTYYRPVLQMMVTDVSASLPEWAALYDWKIELEEI
jgi:hypothetical protein